MIIKKYLMKLLTFLLLFSCCIMARICLYGLFVTKFTIKYAVKFQGINNKTSKAIKKNFVE